MSKICPKCGSKTDAKTGRCPKCGYEPPRAKSKTLLKVIIGASAAVVVCAALILLVAFNIIRLTNEEGDLPGISKGVGLGLWRFACREVVGVVELVTFPFGWTPIIEPEYVVQKKLGPNWKVNRPAFHKNY